MARAIEDRTINNAEPSSIPLGSQPEHAPKSGFIPGIDTIRFIAALWVAMGHGALFPLGQLIDKHANIASLIVVGLWNTTFNATNAVIVFFLVSGLCIHLPNVSAQSFDILSFLLRRLVRIGLPLFAIFLLQWVFPAFEAVNSVLWSVYCEIVYYLAYPALFYLAKRFGWVRLTMISSLFTLAIALRYPSIVLLWQLGPLTPLFCLPFWLGGVLLAANPKTRRIAPAQSKRLLRLFDNIIVLRALAVIYCIFSTAMVDHSVIIVGAIWTVPPFAVFCYYWIGREIEYSRHKSIWVLERLGAISYSMYLTHIVILHLFESVVGYNSVMIWTVQLASVFLAAYIFHRLIELPSHLLARYLGQNVRQIYRATIKSLAMRRNHDR